MKFVIVLVLALSLSACEKNEATTGSEAAAANESQSEAFTVSLRVSATQSALSADVPKSEELAEQLMAGLYESAVFAADGAKKLDGMVMYDVKALPNEAGHEVMLIGGLQSPDAKFDAGVNLQTTDDKWKDASLRELVDGAAAEFVKRIIAQARVVGGDDSALAKILADSSEPLDAQVMALQEVRERRATELLPQVKPFLSEERDPALRLAAAATLVSIGDTSERAEILKVAETFSRDRDPRLVPMLHILGDLGGEEVVTYLQTVADAHDAPAVREVAKEVLKKAHRDN